MPDPPAHDVEREHRHGDAVLLVAIINAYNRMNVIVRRPAGDYQPGQFG